MPGNYRHTFERAVCYSATIDFLAIVQRRPQGYVIFVAGPTAIWLQDLKATIERAAGGKGRWIESAELWTKGVTLEFYKVETSVSSLREAVAEARTLVLALDSRDTSVQYYFTGSVTVEEYGARYSVHLSPDADMDECRRQLKSSPLVRKTRDCSGVTLYFYFTRAAHSDFDASLQAVVELCPSV